MSDQGFMGENRTSRRYGLWPTLRLLAFILVASAAIYASATSIQLGKENKAAIHQINIERAARIDQSCRGDEAEHLDEVTRLTRTYEYLVSLPDVPFSKLDSITKAVVRQVPDVEDEARSDPAPDFCDETGPNGEPIGLPEPDPTIPSRPEKVNLWLEQAAQQQKQGE